MLKVVYPDFDSAFAAWVAAYIMRNGFKCFSRLPTAKYRLNQMMIKEGYLYVGQC